MKKKYLLIGASILLLGFICLMIVNYNGKDAQTSKETVMNKDTSVKQVYNHDNSYLSISVTEYNNNKDTDGGMSTYFYCYDINTEKATKVLGVPYTSQYPLGVYSRLENKIYYTAEVEDQKKGKGDQLFSCDLSTKIVSQLSNDAFAINYIVPMKDVVATMVVKKGVREMKMAFYDKKKDSFEYVNIEEDLEANVLTYNPFINKLAVSFRYESEDYKYRDNFNEGKTDKYILPNHYVYVFDEDYKNPRKILSTQNMIIDRMALDNNENLLYYESDTISGLNIEPKSFSHVFDFKNNIRKDIESIESTMKISDFLFYNNDKNQVFFLGLNPNDEIKFPRGIYLYDLNSKQLKLIFTSKNGFINNFILLNG